MIDEALHGRQHPAIETMRTTPTSPAPAPSPVHGGDTTGDTLGELPSSPEPMKGDLESISEATKDGPAVTPG